MPIARVIPVGSGDATFVLQRTGATRPDAITLSVDPTGGLDQALANSLFDSFATNVIGSLSQAYTLQKVHFLGQVDAANMVAFDSTNTPVTGTRTATNITALGPPHLAFLIRKRTGFAGKRQRGRFYFPGVAEAEVDSEGKISGTIVSSMQAAFSQWFTALNGFAKPMLAHTCFFEEDQPPCIPPAWTPIVSFEVDDVVATQRRRLKR